MFVTLLMLPGRHTNKQVLNTEIDLEWSYPYCPPPPPQHETYTHFNQPKIQHKQNTKKSTNATLSIPQSKRAADPLESSYTRKIPHPLTVTYRTRIRGPPHPNGDARSLMQKGWGGCVKRIRSPNGRCHPVGHGALCGGGVNWIP